MAALAAPTAPGIQAAPPVAALPNNGSTYGQPAPAPAAPTTSPTIGSLYSGVSSSDQNVIDAANSYKGVATTPVDEDAIRSNVMDSLQSEIDATNQVYAKQLQAAQTAGANLVGSTNAANARGGLTGSDFGTANSYNAGAKATSDIGAVQAAQQAAIQAIIDKGQTEATNEINQKQTAQKNGADSYINFLNAAQSRQQTRTTNAAQAALSGNLDLTSAPDATIKAIADSYQIDPAALVSAYVASKNAANTTAATLTKPIAATAGDSSSQFDPKTGQYTTTQGTPLDSTLKEYQYAVANNNFTGSLADWNAQKANQKVSDTVTHNPLTGGLQVVQRAGPQVAGTGTLGTAATGPKTAGTSLPPPTATSAKLPSGTLPTPSTQGPAPTNDPAKPFGLDPSNTIDALTLQFIQTGTITGKAKSYPGYQAQILARAQQVIPGFNPAVASGNAKEIGQQIGYVADTTRAINTADANFNLLLTTLKGKVNNSESPLVNQYTNLIQSGTLGNAQVDELKSAVTSLQTEYSQVLGRGGTVDDATRASAANIINGNYSMNDLQTVYNYVKQEGQNVIDQGNKEIQTLATYGGSDGTSGSGTPKGSSSDSDFVSQAVTSAGANYNDVVSNSPTGQIPVVLNSSGQIGYIPPNEFDPSIYTKM